MVICIGRANGSGGRTIGRKLAKQLGYDFYDAGEIDRIAAETTGHAEIPVVQDLGDNASIGETTAMLQRQSSDRRGLIQAIAERGNCVLVEHCADYVLKQAGIARLSVFITAPFHDRINRKMEENGWERVQAATEIKKVNIQRESSYNLTTGEKWGDPASYDLCINSSTLGIEGTAQALADFVKARA